MFDKTENKKILHKVVIALVFIYGGCAKESLPTGTIKQAIEEEIVAAIQFDANDNDVKAVDSTCLSEAEPSVCAVKKLVEQAHSQGATLVVAPEYGLGQTYLEPDPTMGENPGTDDAWPDDTFIKIFSKQAAQLGIYILINLQTYTGKDPNTIAYNTLVAFDPTGKVVGVHHKFELFSSESESLTPGTDVMVFDSSLGKVGLLICADMYGDLRLQDKLVNTLGARIVAVSSFWTANGGYNWQKNFARNWGVYVIGSNTTYGAGQGGGIFDPDGQALDLMANAAPGIAIATIPGAQ